MDREGEVGEPEKGEKVDQGESEGGKGETEGGKGESEGGKGESGETSQEVGEKKKAAPAKSGKVEVRLQAAGDAPIMKQKNYKVRETQNTKTNTNKG